MGKRHQEIFIFQRENKDLIYKNASFSDGYFLKNVLIDFVIMQTSYSRLTQPRWYFYTTGRSAGLFTPAPLQTLEYCILMAIRVAMISLGERNFSAPL